MSKATMVIEGFAAEPKARTSQSGKRMLDVSVAHSPRRFNKQSNQWEDVTDQDGKPVTTWARATFFGEKADAVYAAVQKGALVRMEGEPRLNAYTNNQGQAAASLELQFADIAVVVQKPAQQAQGGFAGGSGQGQGEWVQPGANGAQNGAQGFGGGFDDSPF